MLYIYRRIAKWFPGEIILIAGQGTRNIITEWNYEMTVTAEHVYHIYVTAEIPVIMKLVDDYDIEITLTAVHGTSTIIFGWNYSYWGGTLLAKWFLDEITRQIWIHCFDIASLANIIIWVYYKTYRIKCCYIIDQHVYFHPCKQLSIAK